MADDELIPFVLKNIDSSVEKKGSGAYGTVYKVSVKGVTCIAKRLHDILVTDVSPRERASIQRKFAAECVLLSKLRHPNVVHFVGVHYGRSANDLSLIMECLQTDLAKFLEGCSSEIPLSIKLSILLDVSYGLLYFHTHSPPIIHRDLSANNVLLTTDLRAKIADLGVAKLLDCRTQAAIAQTKAPGSQDYMSPEALQEIPVYNYKLDIFSFGHLTLYVAGQKFPVVHDLSARDMYSALKQSTVQIQRRRRAIELIGGERHTLYTVITKCLQDKPEHRPATTELNASLKDLCVKHPHSVAEVTKVMVPADKVKRFPDPVKKMATENEYLRQEVLSKTQQVKQYKKQVDQYKEKVEVLKRQIEMQIQQIEAFAKEAEEWRSNCNAQRSQGESLKRRIVELEQVNSRLRQCNSVNVYKEKVSDDQTKHDHGVGKQKVELAQMEGGHLKERLAETEQLYQRREGGMRNILGEASKSQQEVQHSEMEGHNTELLKERNKLQRELDKARKELEKAKSEAEKVKKETEKRKKEAKKKLSDKGTAPPEPAGLSIALEEKLAKNEQLYVTLRNENDDLRDELNALRTANMSLKEMLTHGSPTLQLSQSCKSSEHLMTPPAFGLYGASLPGQQSTLMQQLEEKFLQAAQDEQLQLRQQTDRIIQNLKDENKLLKHELFRLRGQMEQLQAQQAHQSKLWEVSREEVDLNMQKFLGTGAWGFVVEGTFRGQQVAVKCMHDMIRSPKFVELMCKEIGIMAQVRHPNLVMLIAAVIDTKNSPLIVTELLDISLRNAYEKKRLQGSSKLSIFRNIAAALNYLHLHHCGEIIHRDVSSANVLLEAKPNNQWKAKLSDFGCAKLAIEAKSTAPGALVYSAPEVKNQIQIRQTAKIDVYSYGILLCEVIVEQFPHEESLPSMIQEVQGKWAFMHRLITSCVQYHPDNRPTVSYVLGELNKLQS